MWEDNQFFLGHIASRCLGDFHMGLDIEAVGHLELKLEKKAWPQT